MVLPILLSERFKNKKKKFIALLDKIGIETRPIISGNFANQPAAKLYKLCKKSEKFEKSQTVQDLGFLIGLHTKKISKSKCSMIYEIQRFSKIHIPKMDSCPLLFSHLTRPPGRPPTRHGSKLKQ